MENTENQVVSTLKVGQTYKNYSNEKLEIKQVNKNYYQELSYLVEIDGVQHWFDDAQLFNFINN